MGDAPHHTSRYHHRQLPDGNSTILTMFPNPNPNPNPNPHSAAAGEPPGGPLIFPHSIAGRASAAPEPVKRKRGRPRKYGALSSSSSSSSLFPSPPPSALSSLPSPSFSSLPHSSPRSKKDFPSLSPKKAQLAALGNAGQGFTPHVIIVAAGEDVAQNIMSFIQQHKRAVCILSASGSVSNASLCQPAMLGGNVTYEGRFEILSLSGSFLHMETGGGSTRTGGLNICLSGTDGRIVGGGVGGPLIAAVPVQVIVGSFLIDPEKNVCASSSMDNSGSKMSAPVLAGATLISPVSLRSCQESSGRMTPSEGSDDHPSFGGRGSSYGFHSQGMPIMPSTLPQDWRASAQIRHAAKILKQIKGRQDSPDEG